MRHFATAEAKGDFDLVAFFHERLHRAQLHLVVVLVDVRADLDLLDLDHLLLFARFVLLFLDFVFVFAEIENFTNWRISVRADLKQVEANGVGAQNSVARAQNALHFPVLVDETDLGNADFLVNAWPVAGGRCRHGSSGYGGLLWKFLGSLSDSGVGCPTPDSFARESGGFQAFSLMQYAGQGRWLRPAAGRWRLRTAEVPAHHRRGGAGRPCVVRLPCGRRPRSPARVAGCVRGFWR